MRTSTHLKCFLCLILACVLMILYYSSKMPATSDHKPMYDPLKKLHDPFFFFHDPFTLETLNMFHNRNQEKTEVEKLADWKIHQSTASLLMMHQNGVTTEEPATKPTLWGPNDKGTKEPSPWMLAEGLAKKKASIPVVVVEEHHDVIPYWYRAADLNLVSPVGNVLLHIDAHSDGRVPNINASFPLFRTPHLSELAYLMQRNDMFISGAALTGFLSRYIWVIPQWDSRLLTSGFSDYSRFHIFLGFAQQSSTQPKSDREVPRSANRSKHSRTFSRRKVPKLCFCVYLPIPSSVVHRISEGCYRMERSVDSVLGFTGSYIPEDACQVRHHVLVEMVMEDKAIEMLINSEGPHDSYDPAVNFPSWVKTQKETRASRTGRRPWLSEEESIILDIDEDFYGVEPGITSLLRANISDLIIDTLVYHVNDIFCPRNASEESLANDMFSFFVESLQENRVHCDKKYCLLRCGNEMLPILDLRTCEEVLLQYARKVICPEYLHSLDILVCSLTNTFKLLNRHQLQVLTDVGICLKESPSTMGFDPSRGMTLCTGHNRPGRSAVLFHHPDDKEIGDRTKSLTTLFQKGQFTPRLITMARSVRDGYTPRKHAAKIEEDLLSILQTRYPQILKSDIIYDPQLLGSHAGMAGPP